MNNEHLKCYDGLDSYLQPSELLDFGYERSIELTELSFEITTYSVDMVDYIKNAYEYVRDKIAHSADIEHRKVVTCSASAVLKAGEGLCFAKSHLLAAILRCNLIPVGFCYQRLLFDGKLVLHGLNAVYIEELDRWIRLDPRGNKQGVYAQFSIDVEKLAFPVHVEKGEQDIPIIFAEPDKNVIKALMSNNMQTIWDNLPTELDYTGGVI
jgi:transglutaminase-like putative cysteine protease